MPPQTSTETTTTGTPLTLSEKFGKFFFGFLVGILGANIIFFGLFAGVVWILEFLSIDQTWAFLSFPFVAIGLVFIVLKKRGKRAWLFWVGVLVAMLAGATWIYLAYSYAIRVFNEFEAEQIAPQNTTKIEDIDTSDWQTYQNQNLGFSLQYPREWKIDQNKSDQSLSSLVTLKFTIGQTWGVDRDEFLGLVSCFANMNTLDPFYLGEFGSSEPIEIDGVETSIYYNQGRGLGTLRFYIPLIKQDRKRCGIFFQSFTSMTEVKRDIITSLNFAKGFAVFADSVEKQFDARPPTKG